MRTTRAFIVRLFVDTEDPGRLRGVLRPVAEDEERSFSGQESLVALLQGMVRAPGDEATGGNLPGNPASAVQPVADRPDSAAGPGMGGSASGPSGSSQ